MPVVLNEVKQAEQIIADGEIGSKPSATLFLLGKYYRQKENLNKTETVLALDKFMQHHYKNYNPALWEEIIENISKKANKYPLKEINSIGITQLELDCIKSLNNLKYEKLVFAMLCHAKLYNIISENNNGWVNTDIPEIYRLARVTVKHRNDKFLYLNDIESTGLISFSSKNDNLNLKINFVDMDGSSVLYVNDFRELGYEYLNYYSNGIFKRCEICNRLIRLKSTKATSTKYCNECSKKIKNSQNKEYYRRQQIKNDF